MLMAIWVMHLTAGMLCAYLWTFQALALSRPSNQCQALHTFHWPLLTLEVTDLQALSQNHVQVTGIPVVQGTSCLMCNIWTCFQAMLAQKERFMSSVSHELRTPLNGIIGISEGMLSGCCGVLPEGVRRQIYIIRTSGARLLALINDVMDAAALRQNKLVLKSERVRAHMPVHHVGCIS